MSSNCANYCLVLDWAASGAMALTGPSQGPPSAWPAGSITLLREMARTFRSRTEKLGRAVDIDPTELVTGRAGLLSLRRRGQTSAGGAARLLRTRDGWCAVSLSREDDLLSVPALIRAQTDEDPWDALTTAARTMLSDDLVDRAAMLSIPAAALPQASEQRPGESAEESAEAHVSGAAPEIAPGVAPGTMIGPARRRSSLSGARVVDLSSMWAGPLCAHLLRLCGADVVTVENPNRPNGSRSGPRSFHDWLHAGHRSVALDFTRDQHELTALITAADIVIEASRPRALTQLGVGPQQLPHPPGRVWVSITGYGRSSNRVAFGDDAAVGGGLVGQSAQGPVFCADAMADPLTGIAAALAAVTSYAAGGGQLVEVAMHDVARAFAREAEAARPTLQGHEVRRLEAGWTVSCPVQGERVEVAPPRVPQVTASAPPLGTHTAAVLAELHRPR